MPEYHQTVVVKYLSTSLHVFVTHRLVTWMLSPNQICLYYRKYILFSYAHVINFAFKLSAFFYCLPLCLSNFLVRANSLNCFFEQWSRYRWVFVIDPYFGIFCMGWLKNLDELCKLGDSESCHNVKWYSMNIIIISCLKNYYWSSDPKLGLRSFYN